jgi:hypothetical protein
MSQLNDWTCARQPNRSERETTNFSILQLLLQELTEMVYTAAPRRAHPIHQPRTWLNITGMYGSNLTE